MLKTILLTGYFLSVPTAVLAPAVLMHGPVADKPAAAPFRSGLQAAASSGRMRPDRLSATPPVDLRPTSELPRL